MTDHEFIEITMTPVLDLWDAGEMIIISGRSDGSEGFKVTVIFENDDGAFRETSTHVQEDGTWYIQVKAPNDGTYTMRILMSVPGGTVTDEKTYLLEIGKGGEENDEDGFVLDMNLVFLIVGIMALAAVLIGFFIVVARKRTKAVYRDDDEDEEDEGEYIDRDEYDDLEEMDLDDEE